MLTPKVGNRAAHVHCRECGEHLDGDTRQGCRIGNVMFT